MREERAPLLSYLLAWLLPLWLLFVWGSAAGQETTEYVGPHKRTKDLTALYGRYQIYEVVKHRGGLTPEAEAQAWVGQELIVTASLLKLLGGRIENPVYEVWVYPGQPEGVVVHKSEWWSTAYRLHPNPSNKGDEVIKAYNPNGKGPWYDLEIIGSNELWVARSNWYYKARKTTNPVLSPGHADYCQVMGPCSAGQGDCDSNSECQSGLKCVDDRGAHYGFATPAPPLSQHKNHIHIAVWRTWKSTCKK